MENDTTDDNGDRRGQIADEPKSRRCRSDVTRGNEALQRNERGLKVRPNARAGNYLKDDDARPGRLRRQIDVETESDDHEKHAKPDGREILARFADENPRTGGHDSEREDEREEVHTREKRRSAQDGLEVEGKEEGIGDEDEAMHEAGAEGGNVGALRKEPQRHQGVLGDFPFNGEEKDECDDSENDQADDNKGGPGMCDAAEFQAKEKHDGAADYGECAEPVDGFETGD